MELATMSRASDYAALLAQMTYKDAEGDVVAEAWIEDGQAYVRLGTVVEGKLLGIERLSAREMLLLCRWGIETLEEK